MQKDGAMVHHHNAPGGRNKRKGQKMSAFYAGVFIQALQGEISVENTTEKKGGVFLDEETLELAGKMEDVAHYCYENFQSFLADLLTVVKTAEQDDDDVYQAIVSWIDAMLEGVNII